MEQGRIPSVEEVQVKEHFKKLDVRKFIRPDKQDS